MEGADPCVIYEDRRRMVMNKKPVAEKEQSAHILRESGAATFNTEPREEAMNPLSWRKYVFQ